MPYFPEEQGQSRLDALRKKPADLLARSGLPVPEFQGTNPDQLGAFNADLRRLIARIVRMFSIIAPTKQGEVIETEFITLGAHAPQHQVGGTDPVYLTSLTASGMSDGQVLRATGPTTYEFQAIQDGDLPASIARDSELPNPAKILIRVSLGF